MLSIGAFAQVGQVTHRQLRHWDAEGLLVPAHVDEYSGYRSYDPWQLGRLHRIVALRELGFGLEDIARILDQGIDLEHLARLLRERRDHVEAEHRIATARLADVGRRLHLIEKEKHMPTTEIIQKSLPAVRLASRSATVREQPEIAGVVGPMFDEIAAIIGDTCGALDVAIAHYDFDESGIRVTAGYGYSGEEADGFEIIDLPAVQDALVGVHLGGMDRIHESWQAVHTEILARGFVPDGPCRENYIRAESDDQADWVTELQQPVRRG
jgi:DNA-binding transcriptional MerR regulator